MNTYIKILKINIITSLLLIISMWEILYAADTQGLSRKEIREQRLEKQNNINNSTTINSQTDKVITPEFREKRQEIKEQQESWWLTDVEARRILRQERLELEDKDNLNTNNNSATGSIIINEENSINSGNINSNEKITKVADKKRVLLRDSSTFQNKKDNAVKQLKEENKQTRLNNQETRQKEMQLLKEKFEVYKLSIIEKVKDWTLTKQEARIDLDSYRENTINIQRDIYKSERETKKQENIIRVNNIVSDKIKEHFSKYDNLTSNQQLEKYNNILEKINTVLNSNNMTDKQKILLNIIKDVITIKKNSLS